MSPTWSRCCFCPKPSPSLTFPMVSSQGWGCSLQRRQNVKTGHNWGKPLWFPSFWQISVHHPPRQWRELRKDPTLKICPCWEDLVLPGSRWLPFWSLPNNVWVNLFETLLKVNASSHNPKVYTLLSIRNCPQQPFISDLCSPFPSGQSTIEDFKFSHLITWGETSLLSRGIFQPLKLPVLDIFLLPSLFWTIIIRVSYRAVNKQTFAGA